MSTAQENLAWNIARISAMLPREHPGSGELLMALDTVARAGQSWPDHILREHINWARRRAIRMQIDMLEQEMLEQEIEQHWELENGTRITTTENRDTIRPWTFRERMEHMPNGQGVVMFDEEDPPDLRSYGPPPWLVWTFAILLAVLVACGWLGWI